VSFFRALEPYRFPGAGRGMVLGGQVLDSTDDLTNLVAACTPCNASKQDRATPSPRGRLPLRTSRDW
jgi:hypothetical protein